MVQFVCTDSCVETWQSKQLLEELRETMTLTAGERWTKPNRELCRWLHQRLQGSDRQEKKSNPDSWCEQQHWLMKHELVKVVGNPCQNGGPWNGGCTNKVDSQNGLIGPVRRGSDRVGDRWRRRRSDGVRSWCRRCPLGEISQEEELGKFLLNRFSTACFHTSYK